jgi:hypothetical protein
LNLFPTRIMFGSIILVYVLLFILWRYFLM